MNNCSCNLPYPNAPQNAVLRKATGPNCDVWAVIPSYTVQSKVNLEGIKDAFVHVEDINTTYYLNNLHQPIKTWAGPLFKENYDYRNNPLDIRDNIVYDIANNMIIAYDRLGAFTLYGIGTPIDDELSTTSMNAIANKVITEALQDETDKRATEDAAIRQDLHDEMERVDTIIDNEISRLDQLRHRIPVAPTANGTYILKAVVSSGVANYTWVRQ